MSQPGPPAPCTALPSSGTKMERDAAKDGEQRVRDLNREDKSRFFAV